MSCLERSRRSRLSPGSSPERDRRAAIFRARSYRSAGFPLGERCLAPQLVHHVARRRCTTCAAASCVGSRPRTSGRAATAATGNPPPCHCVGSRSPGSNDGRVRREPAQQIVALMATRRRSGAGGNMGLVDDDHLGRVAQERLAIAVALDEIGRNDDDRIDLEERLPYAASRSSRATCRRQDAVDHEVLELALPLFGEMRGRKTARRLALHDPGARARSVPPRSSCRCRRRRRSAGEPDRGGGP